MRKYFIYFLIVLGIAGLFAMIWYSVPPRPQSGERNIAWHRVLMDGSRSGNAVADSSASFFAAQLLDNCREGVAKYSEVIGHSAGFYDNPRTTPDLPLGNLVADALRERGTKEFGVKMDAAIINYGGIRVPLPEGDITYGDIVSMFPFGNKIAYVKIKGDELQRLMDQLAKTVAFQPVSGIKVKVKDHKVKELSVGGKAVNPNKTYNLMTVDFLLQGGDGLYIGAMASDVRMSDVLIQDVMMDFIRSREASHRKVTAYSDGRVVLDNRDEKE